MQGASVTIVKDERLTNIDEAALRRGDILVCQAGDLVAADLRLLEATNLAVDEFELTGEIGPVFKRANDDDTDALQLESPLAPGVRELIGNIGRSGIRSVMLTGDRPETAGRVGEETGIAPAADGCLTGRMIERMALSAVAKQSAYCSVFARLLPSQKGVLIRLFQQEGHRVAMVGDGPNGGIALRVADVGISFLQNASPIATRQSEILVNELRDIGRLTEAGHRIRRRARYWEWFRVPMLLVSLCSPYIWVASSFTWQVAAPVWKTLSSGWR